MNEVNKAISNAEAIRDGLAALMAIQTAIAEGDPCKDNVQGMYYVLTHLIEEADELEGLLLEAAASQQASRV